MKRNGCTAKGGTAVFVYGDIVLDWDGWDEWDGIQDEYMGGRHRFS